ncbi:MAG: hypothetical protein N2383_13835 [Caldilineales bacterium]|nr:hypothetical protein [Caldilineales bacterium]
MIACYLCYSWTVDRSDMLDFIGSGYLYPGSTRVQATISGRLRA